MLALSALSTSFLVPALRASPPLSSLPAQSAGLSPAPPAVVAEAARRGGGVVRMEETEGPSETLQALGVAGGLTAFCFAFFYALTSAGVDDVVAGNLLLVALAAAGAGLFFFDGGATQAALEASAVQQVANEEGDLMEQAPLLPPASLPAAAVATSTAAAAASLESEGVLFVDGLLEASEAARLRSHVEEWLETAKTEAADDTAPEQRFGGVLSRASRRRSRGAAADEPSRRACRRRRALCRASPHPRPIPAPHCPRVRVRDVSGTRQCVRDVRWTTRRYDLYLPLDPPVASALEACAAQLAPLLEEVKIGRA